MKNLADGVQGVDKKVVKKIKGEYKFWHRFIVKNEDHLLFAAFVAVLVGLIVVNAVYVVNRDKPSKTVFVNTTSHEVSHVLTSLQKAGTQAFDVSIANITENTKDDPAFRIEADQTMLILDVTIKNNGKGAQDLVPVSQLFVKTEDGILANLHPSMFITKPLEAKSLPAGESITGQISFAIPKTAKQPELYIDLGWGNQAPVVFNVLK